MKNEQNKTIYRFNGLQLEIMPYYLYDFTIYEYTKDYTRCILQRYYKSNKYHEIPNKSIKHNGNLIERTISLIGAPIEFITENNLHIYELEKRKKK